MTFTTIDYLKAIKQHLEIAKKNDPTGILHKPSPAQLRNYCLLLFDNGLKPNDEIIFRHFFQANKEEDLRKKIQHYDIDRLKAIQKFIDGNIDSPNFNNLELIAVIIDFKGRPYNHFSKQKEGIEVNDKNKMDYTIIESNIEEPEINIPKSKKNFYLPLFILVIIVGIGITIKTQFFPPKDCMKWNIDHYEKVECSCTTKNNLNDIKLINDEEINLKKIIPNQSTIFFKDGKPIVWYCKINGKLECYSSHGYHPITGKPLKPITKYMIRKYLNQ